MATHFLRVICCIAWATAGVLKQMPPFERDFDRNDPLIDHKHRPNQISGNLNWIIALIVPLALTTVVGCLRRSMLEVHHGALALWAGRGFTELITEFLKNRVGRLRPDFLDRCNWDKSLKACAGKLETVMDGRRSFPSGHSSTAWAGMTFLSLWIAGMMGAWHITQPAPGGSFLASRLARLSISLAPLVFATWVALSRVEDYRHHKEDVIVGASIGFTTAAVCYLIYWPSPFADRANGGARARIVYENDTLDRRGDYNYELAGMENAHGA
ncbi:lipid phosphate phosphatase 1 [Obba rivulosa]|uniref:Lipid phosphate phosphatase 1 n=1 Tax=Obba rivulosa TaxID=1052685 RepID=A0A8E2AV04_9APHY|nr:lipid phosphate phosphatase 1 [Obba rivulosa]